MGGRESRDALPEASRTRYLPTLDGWRTVAIALVVLAHGADSLSHAASTVGLGFGTDSLKSSGLFGVQIFFGLSGLLITSRLIEEERRHGRISLTSFYIRRFFRIMPPALVFLFTAGTLALLGVLSISFGRWLACVLCFANYSSAPVAESLGHFWSLAVEEHFYLFWPTAFLLLAYSRQRVRVGVGLALLLALWRAVAFKYQLIHESPAQFWGRTDIQGDGLLWGVVAALMAADPIWRARLKSCLSPEWTVLAFVVLAFVPRLFPAGGWKLGFLFLSVKAIAIPLALLATVLHPDRPIGRLLQTAPFSWIGRLSYSIYLWQALFLVWDRDRVPALGLLQSFPLNFAATLACAMVSYYLIEQPMIALGHRIASRVPRPALVSSGEPGVLA